MDFDDLKQKYKQIPMWGRLLAAAVIGLLPAAYVYTEDSEILDAQMVEAQQAEAANNQAFNTARARKLEMPKLEEQLAFTEEQLAKARKSLPDSYRIEEILERIATIAKETGVKLLRFDPLDEVPIRTPSQYVELPITTEIDGRFSQIAAFFDRIVHLESSIFARKLALTVTTAQDAQGGGGGRQAPTGQAGESTALTPYQSAIATRQAVRVRTNFQLSVYRSMTPAEEAAGGPAADPAKPATPGAAPAAEGGEG